jgi:5-methyltetrahydrofolate--homocysteine methyltransferase
MSDSNRNSPSRPGSPVLNLQNIRAGSPFVMVGERTNVTGSARFARLVREGDDERILEIARAQIHSGAHMLDVNVDDPMRDSKAEMARILELFASDPDVAKVPVMIDSAHWEVLEAGLKCLSGVGVVNSLSLRDGEEEFRRRAGIVRKHRAAVVFMAFDEDGLAETYDRKVQVCTRGYRILAGDMGFSPQDVILDPAILAVGTGLLGGEDCAVSFIEACRTLKADCPHCLVSGGVSNVSFAYRGNNLVRKAMHTVFLHHAVAAGMDMAIVNIGQMGLYEEVPDDIRAPIEDLILNRSPDALSRVMELAVRTRGQG